MNLINKITLLFIATTQIALGNDILSSVMFKFENDKIAFEQFKYLGILKCLDNRIGDRKNKLFFTEYTYLYNGLYPLSRLIKEYVLNQIYSEFEQSELQLRNFPKVENSVEVCQNLYNSIKSYDLYLKNISKKSHYYQENDEIMFSKEEIEQNMLDYLNIGKVERCRLIDCIPQKIKN
ncbi:hypothetical protein BKK52_09800, partial [Rodentibacter trehalosifermentans]